jgi:hypothetical protein
MPDNHFVRLRVFGAPGNDTLTPYVEHSPQTLFFVWVTLTEHKWVLC